MITDTLKEITKETDANASHKENGEKNASRKKNDTEKELLQEILTCFSNSPKKFKVLLPKRSHNTVDSDSYLNLFKEIHPENKKMYENAHTRILGAILKYNNGQFLKSFLERCGIYSVSIPTTQKKVNVEVERQYTREPKKNWEHKANLKRRDTEDLYYCRPDCLIWNYNRFAIIIENKINHAKETEQQVDNYISAISQDVGNSSDKGIFEKCPEENKKRIYVVYICGETSEMPSQNSLSERSGDLFLKVTDGKPNPGKNLKLVNYKDTLISWLEEDVLPECPYGKVGLTSGIVVYIDYLKHLFDDHSETEIVYDHKEVVGFIRKYFENSLSPFFYERYTAVNNRIAELSNKLSEEIQLKEEEFNEYNYLQAIKHFFLKYHFQFPDNSPLNDTWTIRTTGAFVHIWKKSWEIIQKKNRRSCEICFELYPYQIDHFYYKPSEKQTISCCLRYNGKDGTLRDTLNDQLKKEGCKEIDNYLFTDGRSLELNSDQNFFESFVNDNTISKMCGIIERVIVERFGR